MRRKKWADEEEGRDEDEYVPDMPPIEAPRYLLSYFYEVGPTMSGAMGSAPLTFGEIDAWCNRTGIDLQPWEARGLRRLSIAYLNESRKAEKRDCQPPWRSPDEKPEVSETQAVIRRLAQL